MMYIYFILLLFYYLNFIFFIFSFAYRAKSVKNKPQINEVMSDGALLKRYAKQLAKLQQELEVSYLNCFEKLSKIHFVLVVLFLLMFILENKK